MIRLTKTAVNRVAVMIGSADVAANSDDTAFAIAGTADLIAQSARGSNITIARSTSCSHVTVSLDASRTVPTAVVTDASTLSCYLVTNVRRTSKFTALASWNSTIYFFFQSRKSEQTLSQVFFSNCLLYFFILLTFSLSLCFYFFVNIRKI